MLHVVIFVLVVVIALQIPSLVLLTLDSLFAHFTLFNEYLQVIFILLVW